MGPVGGGRLGAPSEVIQKLMPGKAASNAELALRFVLTNPNVSCALSGMGERTMVGGERPRRVQQRAAFRR